MRERDSPPPSGKHSHESQILPILAGSVMIENVVFIGTCSFCVFCSWMCPGSRTALTRRFSLQPSTEDKRDIHERQFCKTMWSPTRPVACCQLAHALRFGQHNLDQSSASPEAVRAGLRSSPSLSLVGFPLLCFATIRITQGVPG